MPIELTSAAAARVSRRAFLTSAAGALCGGCSALRSGESLLTEFAGKWGSTRWALLSDPHIGVTPDQRFEGTRPVPNFERVAAAVQDFRPDQTLIAGDLALARGLPECYAQLGGLLVPLAQRAPLHLLMGNHDSRSNFLAAMPMVQTSGRVVSAHVIGGVHWVMLDSLKTTNAIPGALGAAQRDWLAQQLDERPDVPAIVCLHHNPQPSPWGLQDWQQLLAILRPRRQVKVVVFGHTHDYEAWQDEGMWMLNLPSTTHAFLPRVTVGWVAAWVSDTDMFVELRATADARVVRSALLPFRSA